MICKKYKSQKLLHYTNTINYEVNENHDTIEEHDTKDWLEESHAEPNSKNPNDDMCEACQ